MHFPCVCQKIVVTLHAFSMVGYFVSARKALSLTGKGWGKVFLL